MLSKKTTLYLSLFCTTQIYSFSANATSITQDLGTLKADNSGSSYASAVSADGRVVVGYAESDLGSSQAFRHNEGDIKMTNLGTLKADNSGSSAANAVSADGRVVVGYADTDLGYYQAFRHNEGDIKMTNLGTLKADNSGNSAAYDVSADGRVVVGHAETDLGYYQAFRHNEGDIKMTNLGTLKADNSGSSVAKAVSADGRVVVGNAQADLGSPQAFRHNEGDIKMTNLGTLKADNSGSSYAFAVSADGRVVVGHAQTDLGSTQAFRHNEGDIKMTNLGTLKADNSGSSVAFAVSADGRVVVGYAETDLGNARRAVIWKTEKAVDLDHTIESMLQSTDLARQILGVYEGQLFSLADQSCLLDSNKNYCIGIYTNYNNVKKTDLYASGLIGALRIANTGWTVGGAVNFNLSDDLINGYDAHGFELPGVGAFVRYNQHLDGSGFMSELKGSYLKQKMTITREALSGAEAGQGETKLEGYLVDLGFGYGLQSTEKWLVTPKLNLRHYDISRDAYDENRHADFLASYDKMGTRNTDLSFAVNSKYLISPKVNVEVEVGSYITLNNDQKDAVVKIDYVGQYENQAKSSYDQNKFRPFVKLATNFKVSPHSALGIHASWNKTTYDENFTQAGLVYSYRW